MKRWEAWALHISTAIVTATGVAYLWMKYFMTTEDPFAIVNHPLQPSMLSLHVLSAPVLTFLLGMVLSTHVKSQLRSKSQSRRKSGLAALFTIPAMVLSGYLLQVSTNESLTFASLAVHLSASGVFALSYIAHRIALLPERGRSASLAAATSPSGRKSA